MPADRPRSIAGGLLDRLRAETPRAAELIECGVRVVTGEVAGEGARWRYRRSAVDPHVGDRVVKVVHGDTRLQLRFGARVVGERWRIKPGFVVWTAVETASGATVEVAVAATDAARLGLPGEDA
ncbi:MAG: hypothetical protein M3140_03695 [Actinomycetota bacterium]|nr:hypothetical protein [Actinomycetota bacterium]